MNPITEERKQEVEAIAQQPKKLTREQRRYKERVEQEAMTQLNSFVSKFYEVFMENDPESPLIEAKKKELSAKWKMYCHHKGLSQKALRLCDENCQTVIDKYNEQLNVENKGYGREAEISPSHPTKESVLEAAKADTLI